MTIVYEIPRVIADMSMAEKHPPTINKPAPGASMTEHLMHYVHTALVRSGRLANRRINRKTPAWPIKVKSINVLGYGAEKVAYRVSSGNEKDIVVSVYHREALGKGPSEVAKQKKASHGTYHRYFGDLVVPTLFTVIDNPWGRGGKPATIAPYIENAEPLSDLSRPEIMARVATDPQFSAQLEHLKTGYDAMRSDDLLPDFASSNLLVSQDGICIFDTGALYAGERLSHLERLHPHYRMLDSLVMNRNSDE